MKNQMEPLLIARLGAELRPRLEEGIERMIKNKILKKGDSFYCAESIRDHINVWSGRGKQPQWIKELLDKGITLDQMRAKA